MKTHGTGTAHTVACVWAGIAGVLLVLAVATPALGATAQRRLPRLHVQLPLPAGVTLHSAILRLGPAYLPNGVEPRTVQQPVELVIWTEARQTATLHTRARLQLGGWPAMVCAMSLALLGGGLLIWSAYRWREC